MNITEGYIPFHGYQTYYRAVGDFSSGKTPLVICHGGPGSTHNRLKVLEPLAEVCPILLYDQIGCGNSPCQDTSLFNKETWCEELDALLDYFHIEKANLLGHSWGGMLIQDYYFRHNRNRVSSLILSSTLPSSKLWAREQKKWISLMPLETQIILKSDRYHDEDYIKAVDEFMLRHCFPQIDDSYPECVRFKAKTGTLSYVTAWGENEFSPTGNLKDFDYTDRLKEIDVPTLILSGFFDLSSANINKLFNEQIKNSKWVLFENSKHCSYFEENEKYLKTVKEFLLSL